MDVNLRDLTVTLRRQFDALTGAQVAQSAASAINKVLTRNRVMMGREIRGEYQMNVFDAKSQIVQGFANTKKLYGTLSGNAGFTPFEYFKITGENNNTGNTFGLKRSAKYTMKGGKKVVSGRQTSNPSGEGRHATFTVTIKKGSSKLFAHAFIANTKNGPMLFNRGEYGKRTNKFGSISRRKPMERLRTLSVWQEITSRKITGKSEFMLRNEYGTEFFRLMTLQLNRGNWR